MRWSVDDGEDELDVLEPLAPGSDDPLPGFAHDRSSDSSSPWSGVPLDVVRPRSPRALRLWLLAGAFGVLSLLHFGAAGYLKGMESDLRDLEEAWRAVASIDADRETADRALVEVQSQYGQSTGLDEQRELLYDAADARLAKLYDEISEIDPRGLGAKGLREEMLQTLTDRRVDFKRERVPVDRVDDVARVTDSLDKTLRRWRMRVGETEPVHLTSARELVERLDRMADEPTGLTIGAIARTGLFVIDVDHNRVESRPADLTEDATVHPVGDKFVVVDRGVARAFAAAPSASTRPRWETPADVGVSSGDLETVWLQHATTLRRVDQDQTTVLTMELPPGSRLVAAASLERALVLVPDQGLMVTTKTGELNDGSGFRRLRGDGTYGMNDTHAAGLDDRGRVLIGRLVPDTDRRRAIFSALRAELPAFTDLAVLQ